MEIMNIESKLTKHSLKNIIKKYNLMPEASEKVMEKLFERNKDGLENLIDFIWLHSDYEFSYVKDLINTEQKILGGLTI